jgi:hypothetical protein
VLLFGVVPSPVCSLSDAPKEKKKKVQTPLTPLQPPTLAFAKLRTDQVQAPVPFSSKIVF